MDGMLKMMRPSTKAAATQEFMNKNSNWISPILRILEA